MGVIGNSPLSRRDVAAISLTHTHAHTHKNREQTYKIATLVATAGAVATKLLCEIVEGVRNSPCSSLGDDLGARRSKARKLANTAVGIDDGEFLVQPHFWTAAGGLDRRGGLDCGGGRTERRVQAARAVSARRTPKSGTAL